MMFAEDILRKILTNLISNALKFTPKGGQVSVYIASLMSENGEKLFISVSDTGKGIHQEDIDRIFNRFYQADNAISGIGERAERNGHRAVFVPEAGLVAIRAR